jgi:hypothetical protein
VIGTAVLQIVHTLSGPERVSLALERNNGNKDIEDVDLEVEVRCLVACRSALDFATAQSRFQNLLIIEMVLTLKRKML